MQASNAMLVWSYTRDTVGVRGRGRQRAARQHQYPVHASDTKIFSRWILANARRVPQRWLEAQGAGGCGLPPASVLLRAGAD